MQMCDKAPKRLPPVAYAIFNIQRQLRKGPAVFGHQKKWIITKSAVPSDLLQDHPVKAPLEQLAIPGRGA